MDKINFETLPDGTCVITVQGVNDVGQPYLRQEIIKQVAVFDVLRSAMCEANSNAVLGEVPNITDENIQELREIILDSGSSRNYQNEQIREWIVRHFA